jgi:hypothetical protein
MYRRKPGGARMPGKARYFASGAAFSHPRLLLLFVLLVLVQLIEQAAERIVLGILLFLPCLGFVGFLVAAE